MRLAAAILALCLAGCVHVRAQSTATGTSTMTGTSTQGPSVGTGAVCQITTTSIPSGTQGVAYTATLNSLNCPASLTWSISVGTLPTGLSLNASTGVISGTPSGSGSSSFTVKVVGTPSTITDIFDTGLTIVSAPSGGAPIPPDSALFSWNTTVANSPSPNTVVTVGDGSGSPCDQTGGTCSYSTSQLATALAAVGCGQTLELQNTVYTLPNSTIRMQLNCDASNWITVTRDFSDTTFPAEGTRVTPCYAGLPSSAIPGVPSYPCASPSRHMPLILKNQSTTLQFGSDSTVNAGTSFIRFVGIQWGRLNTYDLDFGIMALPDTVGCTAANTACMNHQPNHIIFDRNIVQGDAQRQTTRAFNLGGQWMAVLDSYILDIKVSLSGGAGDSQVFAGGTGKFVTNVGWWKLQNDFASASTMGCLFCGAFTEPISPTTTFDGIPHDVWQTQMWFWKNPLWDTQLGQASNEVINIEGQNYGPEGDQEFIVSPSTLSLQQGSTYQLHNVTLNDSGGGLDRMTDSSGTGSVTIDSLACTYVNTTTVGTTPAGTTVTVASVANLGINKSILITGAASGGANYIGTITNIVGTTVTISPATSISVGAGTAVFDPVCIPGGDSTHGHMLKNSLHSVGTSQYQAQNIISWTYIACSAVGVPFIDCLGATTAGVHTVVTSRVISDGRAATLNHNRTLSSTTTITVTSGAPTASISISPSAPDLQIQPSYPSAGNSDAFGNTRQFCYLFFETPNYTQGALTWKVDTISTGNSSVGTIQTGLTGLLANEALYCAGSSTGTHTISVTDGTATQSQTIKVSTSSPIWAMDLKAFTSKNGWEEKCISRGQFDFSLIENAWASNGNGGGQNGLFFLNQSINQANQTLDGNGLTVGYGPEFVSDLLVDHVHGLHGGGGIALAALNVAKGIHRITYKNILMEDLSCPRWGDGFQSCAFSDSLQYSGTAGSTVLGWTSAATPLANDINLDHLTVVGGTSAVPGIANWLSLANNNNQFQLGPFSFTNSIIVAPGSTTFNDNNGETPACNTATGSGSSNTEARAFQGQGNSLSRPCNSTYNISRNALVDNTASPSVFSSIIWQPTDSDATLFRNYNAGNGGDYRVVAGGQYDAGGARCSSDGCAALGADVTGIYSSDQAVRLGVRTGFPLSISTSSLSACTHGVACSRPLTASGGTAPYTWTTPSLDYVPGGAIDILDYAAMPISTRSTSHLSATGLYKAYYQNAGLLFWEKNSQGYPSDIEAIKSDYLQQWGTEMDSSQDAACISHGWPSCFSDPQAYKLYITPVNLWKRYHVPGADDVVYTPGPNRYNLTTNCGADNQTAIDNLGVRGELTGPFSDVTWQSTYGGNIPDNTPYLLAQKWIKCTANDITQCTNQETYWLVQGYGQARWCPATWNGSTYVTGTCTTQTTVSAGGAPTPNFACTLPNPPNSGLPNGTQKSNGAPMSLGDSTGIISGTFNAGTYTLTVQVEDANGLIAQKTFTLTVN